VAGGFGGAAPMTGRGRERKDPTKEKRGERKNLDVMDSTSGLGNAEGLIVEDLTSPLAEGVQE
jgi:hypothetical protein